jgi:hypothetical protein
MYLCKVPYYLRRSDGVSKMRLGWMEGWGIVTCRTSGDRLNTKKIDCWVLDYVRRSNIGSSNLVFHRLPWLRLQAIVR